VYRGGLAWVEGIKAYAARVLAQVLKPSLDKSSRRTELGVVTLVPLRPFLPLLLLLPDDFFQCRVRPGTPCLASRRGGSTCSCLCSCTCHCACACAFAGACRCASSVSSACTAGRIVDRMWGRGVPGNSGGLWQREERALCLEKSWIDSAPATGEGRRRKGLVPFPLPCCLLVLESSTENPRRQLLPWLTRKPPQLLPLLRGRLRSTPLGLSPRTPHRPRPLPPSTPRAAGHFLDRFCSSHHPSPALPFPSPLYASSVSLPDAANRAIGSAAVVLRDFTA